MPPENCPNAEELLAFSLGKLSEEELVLVSEHLETCPNCATTIESYDKAADSFILELRRPTGAEKYLDEPQFQRALALVEAIGREPSFEREPPKAVDGGLPDLGYLHNYQLLERLGEGGMGAVYKAFHTRLKRVAALKVIAPEKLKNADALARFQREMEAVGQLDHPNVVRAHDAGEQDGKHYLVMELVDGIDLSNLVRRYGQLPIADACEFIRQAAVGRKRPTNRILQPLVRFP